MIATNEIRQNTDLLALIGVDLRKVAATGGGEYAGPCPFCGGSDRFRVQPAHDRGGRWFCRGCGEGHWHDAIDFVQKRENMTFVQACNLLSDGQLPQIAAPVQENPLPELSQPPGDDWQVAAIDAINDTITYLHTSGRKDADLAWRYLTERRGLTRGTIFNSGIGYNPTGMRINGYWLEPGITIPLLVGSDYWSINVRRPRSAGKPKYMAMQGSVKRALYRADTMIEVKNVIVTEGEFDSLLLAQYLPEDWAVVSAGSANIDAGLRFSLYFGHQWRILLAFDNDQAGKTGLEKWLAEFPRAEPLPVPAGHNDITDYWAAGGDLAAWVEPYCYE